METGVPAEPEERESQSGVSQKVALHPVPGQRGAELPPNRCGR